MTDLLCVWERGLGQTATVRGLLLMSAVAPGIDADSLANLSIGRRDGRLLNLREALFGPEVHCLTDCTSCGERIEIGFHIDDIRVPQSESGCSCLIETEGYEVRFRLPDSNDLLALENEQQLLPERQLLARCIVDAHTKEGEVAALDLPTRVLSALSQRMSELDPQAEVLLEVSCPVCSTAFAAPFDIVSHLWAELDAWAHSTLQTVHALALNYGWSETEILRMSVGRRRAYLELINS